MKTFPKGWKVTHVRIAVHEGRIRWGTDVEITGTGRTVKFTGKLTHSEAVRQASEYGSLYSTGEMGQ